MKTGFVIMRAQPFHAGHMQLVETALEENGRVVIIIGSSNISRTMKNPWTFQERVEKIQLLMEDRAQDLIIVPQIDYPYSDEKWLQDIRETVNLMVNGRTENATFYAHAKPGNDYLGWFGEYRMVNVVPQSTISATQIRATMLEYFPKCLPDEVIEDHRYHALERAKMSSYPYVDTLQFNCADAVLMCRGYVLMIRRKHAPGRGKLALPGGFKNANETFLDAAIRELIEETGVEVDEFSLRERVKRTQLFDSPTRTEGIPRVTQAALIDITDLSPNYLPATEARDDAADVLWVPVSRIRSLDLFDDHAAIIDQML